MATSKKGTTGTKAGAGARRGETKANGVAKTTQTEAAAKGYANSQVVIVTNATHGVINASPCTRKMARDFLRDPSRPVDRTCLPAADTPLDFTLEAPAA